MSDWGEGLLANCSADDRDGLNDLATELLILGLEKLVQVADQEVDRVVEEWNEIGASFLGNSSQG